MKAILMALLMVFSFTVVGCDGGDKPADAGAKIGAEADKAKAEAEKKAAEAKAEAEAKAAEAAEDAEDTEKTD